MAHILLGWEFGGNRGHATSLKAVAGALRERGHQVSFALQRVDAISRGEAQGSAIWPAPVSPRLLVNTYRPKTSPPASMGDILARLGCDDSAIVTALLRAWDQLLDTIRPDLVIADFAPFLLLAARDRCPTIAKGTGFSTPPPVMARFPSITDQPAAVDEGKTLGAVNEALRQVGRELIGGLPGMFGASRQFAATFTELDPYAEQRTEPLVMPALASGPPEIASGSGKEVFVFAPELVGIDATLWKGLAAVRLPVRVYIPKVPPSYREALRRMGFAVEPEPVPFDLIAKRSRLVVSHGGHGFVCSALLAGLPQVVCHYDLEKMIHAQAVARLGVGGFVPLHRIDPQPFAASLVKLYGNDALAGRARAAASEFRDRNKEPMQASIADAADELVS